MPLSRHRTKESRTTYTGAFTLGLTTLTTLTTLPALATLTTSPAFHVRRTSRRESDLSLRMTPLATAAALDRDAAVLAHRTLGMIVEIVAGLLVVIALIRSVVICGVLSRVIPAHSSLAAISKVRRKGCDGTVRLQPAEQPRGR